MALVDFWEMYGYPQEERDNLGNFRATRRLICTWNDRMTLRQALIGHPGQLYPYVPNFKARVTAVAMEPYGLQTEEPLVSSMAVYEWALLTVRYETPRIDEKQPHPDPEKEANPQAAISENLEPSVEGLRLPASQFKWLGGDALKEEEAPVRLVYRMAYTLTRYNLPEVPVAVRDLVGKINAAAVQPLLLTEAWSFPAHTLLFMSPTINLSADDAGGRQFDVTFRFAYKEEGWRKYWRSDIEAYSLLVHADSGLPYEQPAEADFSVVFP